MSSPRHSPPPSAAAPRPRGILKNATSSSSNVAGGGAAGSPGTSPGPALASPGMSQDEQARLAWDESNLTLHEIEREQQAARMKIDEPKTPFVRSSSLGSMDDDAGFELDSQQGTSYFPLGSSGPSSGGGVDGSGSGSTVGGGEGGGPSTGDRRSSAAEELAANTKANAGLGTPGSESNANAAVSPAVGLDAADAQSQRVAPPNARRGESRSPSFTLPNSRRSSGAGERSREGVREEMRNREAADGDEGAMEGVVGDEEGVTEDQDLDPEAKAKQAAFARKRNAHYGNEAEAMKIAAALAQQDEDDDEEGGEDEGSVAGPGAQHISPVPPMPNGRTA